MSAAGRAARGVRQARAELHELLLAGRLTRREYWALLERMGIARRPVRGAKQRPN